jgi:PAS domain S-box-containing protein
LRDEGAGNRQDRNKLKGAKSKFASAFLAAALLLGLWLVGIRNYLLFHTLAESFSIVIAFSIFIIAWNSRRLMENGYLLFLGIAYLFVGGIDLIHTLAYTGMGVFPGQTTNLATELWIGARYTESLSLLLAPFFLGRRVRVELALTGYLAASALFLSAVFYWDIFPVCFVEGQGLTTFKKVSEYAISLVLLGSAVGLLKRRRYFDPGVLTLLVMSIMITIASELAFTFYTHAYGLFNLVGHYFKIVSFYLIYKALIETGLREPYDLLFRELKQREEALRLSEERYRAIFENTGTATIIIEEDTTISLVNTEFEKLTGYSKREVEGKKSWHEFVRQEDREALQRYHDARRDGSEDVPSDYDLRFIDRDGVERDIHMMVSLIPGTTKSVASAMDITERKRAEEIIKRDKETLSLIVRQRTGELLEAHKKLEEAKRLSGIGTLAATVAHELRNPLGVIRTAILNIRRKSAEPGLDRHLTNIEKKIAESDRIITNLLRYSNIRPPERESADLSEILRECIASTRKRFPGKRVEVTTHLDRLKNKTIELDTVQIKEVFDNILNNAFQSLEDASGRIEVSASLGPDDNVSVQVKDDGTGIDAKTLDMVFEPFFTTRARGTGLGLTITRELVRLHGGSVAIQSEVGSGTVVTVILPAGNKLPREPS